MKLPKDIRDEIIKEFGSVTGGLMIFVMMLLALYAKGGRHE